MDEAIPLLLGKKPGEGRGSFNTYRQRSRRNCWRSSTVDWGQSNAIVEREGFGVLVGGSIGVDEEGMGQFVNHDRGLILHGILVIVKPSSQGTTNKEVN